MTTQDKKLQIALKNGNYRTLAWEAIKLVVKRAVPVWNPANDIGPEQPLNPALAKKVAPPPNGRVSLPPYQRGIYNIIANLGKEYRAILPLFQREVIPVIRRLTMVNADFGQALQNIVALGNTGHEIMFDPKVPIDQVELMRHHIQEKHKEWATGQAGANGVVNRMFSQLMIGGALSNEWVPNAKLTGIEALILVNPEEIVFVLDDRMTQYIPFQRTWGLIGTESFTSMIQLNGSTYRYYALNGDGEVPYGFPPYLSAMDALDTQTNMHKNINYVVGQMGMLGFLDCLISEPDQLDNESDETYVARLTGLLSTAKAQIDAGFKDGTVVGFKDRHEFNYHAISKGFGEAIELYKQNELQMASGLKQDASLWGRDYSSSESQITVVFMKMLAELRNTQNIVATNLEFGYALELRLAGFNFDWLKVKFKKSTIQDDLKFQQAQEYKIRNLTSLLLLGTINETQLANEMEYDAPDAPAPRVSYEILAGVKGQTEENHDQGGTDAGKASKNKSAKGSRSKSKPQGSKK